MISNSKVTKVPWLAYHQPAPRAALRLFCFPYAGGSAFIYRSWAESFPLPVEVCPVQLPGRGSRIGEAPFTQMPRLVETLAREMRPWLDKPFAFFGHSMGAIISFELARLLRGEGAPKPAHLFLSARPAPETPRTHPPTYNLPDAEFREELRRLNGTPREVLEHPELMEVVLPLLRADFELIQTYAYQPEPPLDCSISAFGGLQDCIERDDLQGWRRQTNAGFSLRMFPGDHFFIHTAQPTLLRMMSNELYLLRLLGAND